jgi:hypothetical protein
MELTSSSKMKQEKQVGQGLTVLGFIMILAHAAMYIASMPTKPVIFILGMVFVALGLQTYNKHK